MKIKTLKIRFESFQDFTDRSKTDLAKVLKNKKQTFIQNKNEMVWTSVETFQLFMTNQKLTILAAIYTHKPSSVYQLAKLLNRSQPNVARDCEAPGLELCPKL